MGRPQAAAISHRLIASLCVAFALLFFPGAARPQATSLSPQELFKRLASSVFVVEALSAEGSVVAFGSGVAVASDQVATNRHVVAEGISLRIRQGSRTWPAIVTHLDADHDLCRLKAEGLNTSPPGVRRSSSLQVGERVYAIGAPQGLELTLSEGLVSGLRDNEGVRIIQTTAPVSAGSSGGGLFDAQGRLVGITTFIVAEGQNLNFALPGDWVLALDNHAVSAKPNTKAESLEFQALVWALRGHLEGEAGKHEQAVQAYREAIRLKPDLADAWYNLGIAYRKVGQYQQAVQAYREAIRLRPDDAEAWNNLGIAYDQLGQLQEAIRAYREAIRLKPDLADAWHNLGIAYLALGQPQEAVRAYREAVRLMPDLPDAWNNLGIACRRLGQYDDAVQAYREAIRLKPEHGEAWVNLGVVYGQLGRHREAARAYRQAVHLMPDLADAWYNLGVTYGNLGQYQEAVQAYREAIRLKPDDALAWDNLGVAYALQGNRSKVMEVYQRLKALDPKLAEEFFRNVVRP